MNKKLEELRKECEAKLDTDLYDTWRVLDSFAEQVWNAALTACGEKVEKLDPMGNGIDTHEIAEAIDSLKT